MVNCYFVEVIRRDIENGKKEEITDQETFFDLDDAVRSYLNYVNITESNLGDSLDIETVWDLRPSGDLLNGERIVISDNVEYEIRIRKDRANYSFTEVTNVNLYCGKLDIDETIFAFEKGVDAFPGTTIGNLLISKIMQKLYEDESLRQNVSRDDIKELVREWNYKGLGEIEGVCVISSNDVNLIVRER